ncbi:MAG: HlyD family secretion protein [Limisphaerales bacterium]
MDPLEPIPSPPGHLLREFCHRALPVVAFVAAGVGAAFLWNQRFTGTLLHGEVEPIRASVTTLEGGTVLRLHVDRWQEVTNGQPIATIQVLDPDAVGRSVEILRGELEILRSRLALDESRNDQNLEGLRVRWLEARVQLATSRVQLENARRDLDRTQRLFQDRIIPEAELDNARTFHEALKVEVDERSALVVGLDTSLQRLDTANHADRNHSFGVIDRSLAAQEQQLRDEGTIHLRAPIAGIVKSIAVSVGERIGAGTEVAVVAAPRSERIVGFVRQPLTVEPQPGMAVEIRTRGAVRQVGHSMIDNVGADLELVASPLRLRNFDNSVERGLAFSIPIPDDLRVHPGELVDVIVRKAAE